MERDQQQRYPAPSLPHVTHHNQLNLSADVPLKPEPLFHESHRRQPFSNDTDCAGRPVVLLEPFGDFQELKLKEVSTGRKGIKSIDT